MRRTRVMHVVHGLPRGGLENGVVNLLNELPPERIEQAVCCLDHRGEMAERVRDEVPIHVLDRGRHDLRLPFRLAAVLREWKPDLVHCRNWNTWFDTVLAHRIAGRPGRLIWSFHGFAGSDRMPRRRRLASRLLAGRTDRLLAVCHDSAERYAHAARLDAVRFQVLYNGVDCERFRPSTQKAALRTQLGLPADEVIVLTVASLTPVKAHEQVLAAAALVQDRLRTRARLLWIGEGAERQRLEQRARDLGVADLVHMPGPSDRVPDYLAAADLFVLPSRLEGMSNAILEAMASGLPVIANAVGGNPELILSAETGLLSQPDDPTSMADALIRLIDDEHLRRTMGLAARARAEQVFSLPAMLERYRHYYIDAANKS